MREAEKPLGRRTLPTRSMTYLVVLLAAALGVAACNEAPTAVDGRSEDGTLPTDDREADARDTEADQAIHISPETTVLDSVGAVAALAVTITDTSGRFRQANDVLWRSLDPSIVSVVSAGHVTALSPGTAAVTVSVGALADTATVKVLSSGSLDNGAAQHARSADAFVNSVGVNVHIGYLDRVYGHGFETIIRPKLQELGVLHLRDKGIVVENDGWMEKVYGRMNELAEHGIQFTLINEPAVPVNGYSDAGHIDRLLRFLSPSSVAGMEGLNEHDLSGRDEWAEEVHSFQVALYGYVRQDARLAGVPVLGPSMGRPGRGEEVGDLSAYMDFGVMHPYPGGDVPSAALDYHIRNLEPLNRNHTLVVTESGYHTAPAYSGTHPGVSETAMGKYVPRMFLEYFRRGIPRTFAYEFIDQGTDPYDKERHFGLLRVDGSEKPAFTALENLLELLSDPGPAFEPEALSYTLSGDTKDVHQILLQKRNGRFYLVLWQSTSSYDVGEGRDLDVGPKTLTLAFRTPPTEIRMFVPQNGSAPVGQWHDLERIDVDVPDHPLVVEVSR